MFYFLKKAFGRLKKEGLILFFYRIIRFLIFKIIKCSKYYFLIKYKVLKKRKKRFLTKDILDNKLQLDLTDEGISKDLILYKIREPLSTKYFLQEIKEGDVIIDVGANIGYYALLEAGAVGNTGKVYAIEPVKENINKLKFNIKLNNYSNIEVFEMAIGDEEKIATMYLSNKCNWHSLVCARDIADTIIGQVDVKVTTLDKFIDQFIPNRKIDFIRIDVEGYEYYIVRGMSRLLKENRRLKLFIEVHPHNMKKEEVISFFIFLRENNFEIKKVIFEPPSMLFTNTFISKSLIFLNDRLNEKNKYGYFNLTIDSLLTEYKSLIEGKDKRGAFHVFLEKII
jgi:FkbM family methyltransferase